MLTSFIEYHRNKRRSSFMLCKDLIFPIRFRFGRLSLGSALAPFSLRSFCFSSFYFSFWLKTLDGLPSGKLKGQGGGRYSSCGSRAR